MDSLVIVGNRELKGEIEVRGSKNAAGPVLAAALLTKEDCIIDNLPLIEDVRVFLEIMRDMGARIEFLSERKVRINTKDMDPAKMDLTKFSKTRLSVVLIGALLARFDRFRFPSPGGDRIGLRPITVHINALRKLGARIEKEGDYYQVQRNGLEGKEIVMEEFSPTATEALMLAAVMARGRTIIKGAASELSVKDTGDALVKMGVNIKGHGTHFIEIEGADLLRGFEHAIAADHLEAGTFIIAGALTRGRVVVKNINFEYLDLFLSKLEEAGVNFDKGNNQITVFYSPFLKPLRVQALPYPGFPTDLLPIVIPMLTTAQGKSLVHDPLYENRFNYVHELRKMGGDIEIVDPHRALIFGPNRLQGITIESSDIRAGAALIIAGLIAQGKTVIHNIYQIDRGYEKIEERLAQLGADIQRVTKVSSDGIKLPAGLPVADAQIEIKRFEDRNVQQ